MDIQYRENFLIRVMNSGFVKAASSFSRLIGAQVKITNEQSMLVHHHEDFPCISEEQGELYVLTTQIIGDVSGKSFLIFSEEEAREIFNAVTSTSSSQELKEAFLLEIDNIISASVVSEISNTLRLEIYGDVPQLIKIQAGEILEILSEEVSDDSPSSMIFSNTTFQFDGREKVHPQFVWKLSPRIFELIPDQSAAV